MNRIPDLPPDPSTDPIPDEIPVPEKPLGETQPTEGMTLEELEKRYADVDPWKKIGFSRTLGGFFYQFVLFIIGILVFGVLLGFALNIFYPYPESEGYRNITSQLFSLLFSIFGIGTAYGLQRFIAEWRIKDPRKMLKYIQFFIWYNLISGLIINTIITIFVFTWVRPTDLAYLSWLMLIMGAARYPGMTDVFNSALQGLQRFNKAQILSFLSSYVVKLGTTAAFFLLGRWIGDSNPVIGELLGLSIGATIAAYANDLISMFIGAHFFRQVAKEFGFGVWDCFGHDFGWPIIKECVLFGFQVSVGPLVGTGVGFVINLYWIMLVPQYSTWSQMNGIAGGIANVVTWGTGLQLVPAIAEAFLNNKKELAQYYIAQSWRWNFFLAFPLLTMLGVYLPVILLVLLKIVNLPIYIVAMNFLVGCLIAKFIDPISSFADQIIVASNNQKFLMYARTCEELGKLTLLTLFIPVLHLTNLGLSSIMWILPLGTYPATIVKAAVCWWYVNKKIVPIKFPYGQALIAPLLSSAAVLGVSFLYLNTAWPALQVYFVASLGEFMGLLAAAIVTVVWMLIGTFAVYMFFYGFFGGFDAAGLQVFDEAVDISGPSKNLMRFLRFFVRMGVKVSPFFGKFTIEADVAHRQAFELMVQRDETDERTLTADGGVAAKNPDAGNLIKE